MTTGDVTRADIAVIGAGIAGASVAAHLAANCKVVLLEMEDRPGYHTTGRSAAVYAPSYGPAPIRALTRAAEGFFTAPPDGFTDHTLLKPLGALMLARADQRASLDALLAEVGGSPDIVELDRAAVEALHPLLKKGYAAGGMLDRAAREIDVAALHQGFLRLFRSRGGNLLTRAGVTAMARDGDHWRLQTDAGVIEAATIVNAAGAWADRVGALAGAGAIGLAPKRRTALIVPLPEGVQAASLPITIDIDEAFYAKPEAGKLLISPANEDLDVPSDVQPDEMDIAICIDRIETAFDLRVRRIEAKWAGLRSFVADKSPAAGFSGAVPGFYWLAGQGGYGIQTAPSLSRYAAAEILGQPVPQDILDAGLDPAALSPSRPALESH
jgi:D-arginine dehydrogenase